MLQSGRELIEIIMSILEEFPDRDTYGGGQFWRSKWRFGPAAKKVGYNVEGYVELFNEIEEELGIEVIERIGDSRYFARKMRTMMTCSQPSMITE